VVTGLRGHRRRGAGSQTSRLPTLISLFVLLVLGLLAAGLSSGVARVDAASKLRLTEHEEVGARLGIPLRGSGDALVLTKIVNERTGQIREVITDRVTGTRVDLGAALSTERKAWRRRYGRADIALAARLEGARPAETIRVGIRWTSGGESALRAALDRVDARILRERRGHVEAAVSARGLRGLVHRSFVSAAALIPRVRSLALDMARDLDQAAIDDAHGLGVGVGWLTALWELEACVRRDHPDFRSVTWLPRPGNTPCDYGADGNGGVKGHSTLVAGAFAADRGALGTVGLYRAKLVDVDDTDQANVDRMWALNPLIVNASFTMTPQEAERVDQEVYRRGAYVFTGAGNDRFDTANCWAYNAFCVGGYRTAGSVGQFGDDTTAGYSFLNPPASGREFPHVVGPHSGRLPSPTGTGYTSGHGTSFATPSVAGTAGLLLASYPFAMSPTLMRAVLMASAQAHPVTDVAGAPRIPIVTDSHDDRHGVGAPNAGRAKAIVEDRMYYSDRTFYPSNLGARASITAKPGQRVRVVMTWDQCPYSGNDPALNVDFDLVVRRPFSVRRPQRPETHYNLSSVDNYEVVEFVSNFGGQYSVHVSAPRWSECRAEGGVRRARLALAWTKEGRGLVVTP
jgi:Subtilase family